MASAQEIISDERSFILSALKFTFQVDHRHRSYPHKLAKELKELEEHQSKYFTTNICKVMLIFIDKLCNKFGNAGLIREDVNSMKMKLRNKFNHSDFFYFLAVYLLKCARVSPNFNYEEVIVDIESFFFYVYQHGSWSGLDEAASLYLKGGVQRCKVLCKRENFEQINVSAEEGFIIKLLIYIFSLNAKIAPSYLQSQLIYYTASEPDPFTEDVKQALHILFKNQEANEEIHGFTDFDTYYKKGELLTFNAREYLGYCVLYARRAVLDYSKGCNLVPAKIFQKLINILKLAKGDGIFESLAVMNNAAHLIIEENDIKLENKRVNLIMPLESSREEGDMERQLPGDSFVGQTEIDELSCSVNTTNEAQLRLLQETTPQDTDCACCTCS